MKRLILDVAFRLLLALIVINIGVATGALPTKGIALPLISYGGSGLVLTAGALALILGCSSETATEPTPGPAADPAGAQNCNPHE